MNRQYLAKFGAAGNRDRQPQMSSVSREIHRDNVVGLVAFCVLLFDCNYQFITQHLRYFTSLFVCVYCLQICGRGSVHLVQTQKIACNLYYDFLLLKLQERREL